MRQSQLFTRTLKESPKDEVSLNAQLLIRAGFIDKLMSGVYSYLPLGLKVLRKIQNIVREEMDKINGQEVLMPALNPKENWELTGRWSGLDVLFKMTGVGDKEYALGASHEEIVTPLVQKFVRSYKDLPVAVYQIQNKFRNEPRAKSGLLRGREFNMKDLYSFHKDEADLNDYYEKSKVAYLNIFRRCGLDAKVVEAGGGTFSKFSHEFQVFTEYGEDIIFSCSKCDRHQNKEIAAGLPNIPAMIEEPEKIKKVKVERENSVQASVKLMNIEPWKVLKTVVYKTAQGLLGVVVRGDLNIAPLKLSSYLDDFTIRPALDEELTSLGLVPGFISPVDNKTIEFIADNSVKTVNNWVTGANELHYDYVNVNLSKDFEITKFADLAEIEEGYTCSVCSTALEKNKAIEVGNIFKLKNKYSSPFGFKYIDETGKQNDVVMGCYGIGPSRVMGSVVEIYHDDKGLVWPEALAPFAVHLVSLCKKPEDTKKADKIYNDLIKKGIEVFYDDRIDATAGEKFADSDLIGIPYRIIVSAKTLENANVELKVRKTGEVKMIEIDKIIKTIIS